MPSASTHFRRAINFSVTGKCSYAQRHRFVHLHTLTPRPPDTICASVTLLYLALVIALACAWPPSAPVPSSDNASAFSFIDRTALNCIFGIVFSFWGVMAYLRCLDPRISRRLAAIAVILTLWLTAVTIKWNTTDLKLARYLWYGYYTPWPVCHRSAFPAR